LRISQPSFWKRFLTRVFVQEVAHCMRWDPAAVILAGSNGAIPADLKAFETRFAMMGVMAMFHQLT
jgi:hypothetical protein